MAFCAWCGNPVSAVSYAPCPRCANPTNGAQRSTVRSTNTAGLVIGLVVAFFFVVAIVGILAAIAIPNLLTAMQRSKQKRTMADLRTIATAAEAYATDNNRYPTAGSLDELQPFLVPTYAKVLPKLDGWENAMRYECWPSDKCQEYAVGSGGNDKRFEHGSLQEYGSGTATTSYDCDIVFANGSFVQYPERVETGGSR